MKREDLIHPVVSGNKWRKLKYNLARAKEEGYHTILSFGGAYSNHIHAFALAAREEGFRAIGVIRGEKIIPLNPTLADAERNEMMLHFLSREEYRRKNEPEFLRMLSTRVGDFYHVPEGGSNAEGVKGCMEIAPEIGVPYDVLCAPCGTGTTLAGIIASVPEGKKVMGFPVLKGGDFLYKEIQTFLGETGVHVGDNWGLQCGYHFGGYAKWNEELMSFIHQFKELHDIQLDQVYTGKMMFGLMEMIGQNYFLPGTSIVALHTGGLQGLPGRL